MADILEIFSWLSWLGGRAVADEPAPANEQKINMGRKEDVDSFLMQYANSPPRSVYCYCILRSQVKDLLVK